MNQPHRTPRHRGVSLVELIVIMSAASVILSLSAGLIHRLMHAETAARSLATIERTSLRLAAALRHDVNAATSAITDQAQLADGAFLRLESSATSRIEYRREDQTIHRLEFNGDRVVAREQFSFRAGFDVQIQAEGSRLIAVTITSRNQTMSNEPQDPVQQAKALPVDLHVLTALQRGGQ